MNDKPENPQAYPAGDLNFANNRGMTLRDYFAGQALAGILTQPSIAGLHQGQISEAAYGFSDAMLAEREKE